MLRRRYLIFCNTENAYIEDIRIEGDLPTVCPHSSAHSVNLNLVVDNGSYQDSKVQVTESLSLPVGTFRCEQWRIDIPASAVFSNTYSWKTNIAILNFKLIITGANQGDTMELTVAPNATIGAITVPVGPGTTTLTVQPSVIGYLLPGYYLRITDGVNADNLGQVLAINAINNTVTVEIPTVHSFSPATPTYVQMAVKVVTNFEFGPAGAYNIGKKKLGGHGIPANVPVLLTYNNNTSTAKKMWAIVEYLY